MQHYYHNISSDFISRNKYPCGNSGKMFASPLKELNQKTVFEECTKLGGNDSFRAHTKYDDKIDQYYSSYDMAALIGNDESYLEGKINKNDVDYYSFNYGQKAFYDKMGISTSVKIQIENSSGSQNLELCIYDSDGNYLGSAKDNGNGGMELVIPNYEGCKNSFTIRVSGTENVGADEEGTYRIRISEVRGGKPDNVTNLTEIKQREFQNLPENEKYLGDESIDKLLRKWASGKSLDISERRFIEIFSNIYDYERAEASNYLKSNLLPQIKEELDKAGILADELGIEIDIFGNVSVNGDLSIQEREDAEKIISDKYREQLWSGYLKASDLSVSDYRLVEAYKEVEDFLKKTTDGAYSFEDISVDKNCRISGVPTKLCDLLNSQESNARYEELRDNILMVTDYKNAYGQSRFINTKATFSL